MKGGGEETLDTEVIFMCSTVGKRYGNNANYGVVSRDMGREVEHAGGACLLYWFII